MQRNRVLVVGAGIGGLSSAVWLARAGFDVTVCERAPSSGGKMRQVQVAGAAIDAGPTVMTMRWVFDDLFESAGAALDQSVTLTAASVLARHAWGPDERLDLYADASRSEAAIGDFAGSQAALGYRAFCAEARRMYETLRKPFLAADATGPLGLTARLGPARIGDLLAIRPFDTMWSALGAHFADPRLQQLFGRYATYCGASPFAAPATLMLIAHVEQEGVWLIEGGMQRLAEALQSLAMANGVVFRHESEVRNLRVAGGCATGVTLASGEVLESDHVIINADAAALASGTFGPEAAAALGAARPRPRSLSALTFTALAETSGFPLTRHNVFFSGDYAAEFSDIFEHGRLPAAPTIYVCAQDRNDSARSPGGAERLLILVNAPPNGDHSTFDSSEVSACENTVFETLSRCGLQVERRPDNRTITTPADFSRLFPATGGALYGQATHGWAAAFQRPGARTRLPGLYLAGGSVHPGAGVPMAALSGRLAAKALMKDRALTVRRRPAAMHGGTSTP